MTDNIKIVTQEEAKDAILEYAFKNWGKTISAHEIQKELLPNLSEDEVEFLFQKIQDIADQVANVEIGEYNHLITATGLTKRFLSQGGFTTIEKNKSIIKEKEAEIERIGYEKSILDLRLKRWQLKTFWWIFSFAILGSGLGVYNFVKNLNSPNNIKKQEERIEKMELKIEKLQTTIINRIKVDNVQTTNKSNENGN